MDSKTLLDRHLSQASLSPSEDLTCYAEEVVAEFPYAPEDHTQRLEGRDAVVAFMRRIPTFAQDFSLSEPVIHETATGFIAEYHGEATFKSTGKRYAQDYISVFTVRDGKIVRIKEYYDPLRVLRAMGEID